MYNLNIEKYENLLNWTIIYWGIKCDILSPETAVCYADMIVGINPDIDAPEIIELLSAENVQKNNILMQIQKLVSSEISDKERSLKIIRYILLKEIQSSENALEEAEKLYVEFDYPEDMEEFIAYMPVRDKSYNPAEHTEAENKQRLVGKLSEFISNDEKNISFFYPTDTPV